MQVISFSNLKGGVGKTVLTMNCGKMLAEHYSVLLIDADSQGSLSSGFRLNDGSMAKVMAGDRTIRDAAVQVGERLHIVPADLSLANAELQLVSRIGRENVLRRALQAVSGRFDVVLIDTPPSLSLMSLNALCAADGVVIPVKPEGADLKGLSYFFQAVDQVKREINPDVEIIGLVLNFYDDRLLHQGAGLDVLKDMGHEILGRIRSTVRISEAYTAGQSLPEYAPDNRNVEELSQITRRIHKWLNKKMT